MRSGAGRAGAPGSLPRLLRTKAPDTFFSGVTISIPEQRFHGTTGEYPGPNFLDYLPERMPVAGAGYIRRRG